MPTPASNRPPGHRSVRTPASNRPLGHRSVRTPASNRPLRHRSVRTPASNRPLRHRSVPAPASNRAHVRFWVAHHAGPRCKTQARADVKTFVALERSADGARTAAGARCGSQHPHPRCVPGSTSFVILPIQPRRLDPTEGPFAPLGRSRLRWDCAEIRQRCHLTPLPAQVVLTRM